jgi:mRNA interferase YafQ
MLDIVQTTKFKKDLKRCIRRGWDMEDLSRAIGLLQEEKELPESYRAHPLIGDRLGQMDLHVRNDWVLIYRIDGVLQLLRLERTGSHDDLGI